MNIDITDLKSRDIIKILEMYHQGHLETKFERIFWCSDYLEPETRYSHAGAPTNPGSPPPQPRKAIERMSDALGSMVQVPTREDRRRGYPGNIY